MNQIVVDETIFRDKDKIMPGFNPIPYVFNINHPTINKLWLLYLKKTNVPKQYLPSNKHRLHFEQQIMKMIENKKLIIEYQDSPKIKEEVSAGFD